MTRAAARRLEDFWRSLPGVIAFGLAIAAAGLMLALSPAGQALEEDLGLGWLFHLRGAREAPASVAIVAVDRTSAEALGLPQRPSEWPRGLHAQLIDALVHAGVRTIAFDLLFTTQGRDPADDERLADAMARAGNVVLLDRLELDAVTEGGALIERHAPPIPRLAQVAAGHGPFPLPKARAVHGFWLEKAGRTTFPVIVARHFGQQEVAQDGPASASASRYLDYYGPPQRLSTVAYHAVLRAASEGEPGRQWLRETLGKRAVFVGFSAHSAAGQDVVRDDYFTAYARADGLHVSGVEIAATAFANLVEQRTPQPLAGAPLVALITGWGLLLAALCFYRPGLRSLATVVALSAAYLGLAQWRFAANAGWLPLVTPLLAQAPLALLGGSLLRFRGERGQRRRLSTLVDELLPPQVLQHLVRTHRLEGDQAIQSFYGVFLMTDVRGFTAISERLTPAAAAALLNQYFALVFPAVERHGGSVSEIDGDGMLAFWIADPAGERPHRQACLAALDIVAVTSAAGAGAGAEQSAALPTRIGVHGGMFALARVGASRHFEYRAIGDAANTAGRLEALSKHLGTRLLVSGEVAGGLDEVLSRPLGTFLLAGKKVPIQVHELLERLADASEPQHARCAAFAQALQHFHARRWTAAIDGWSALLERWPTDGPSQFYRALAQALLVSPPEPGWDGSVKMVLK